MVQAVHGFLFAQISKISWWHGDNVVDKAIYSRFKPFLFVVVFLYHQTIKTACKRF